MTLKELMTEDLDTVILNLDEHAEEIGWKPFNGAETTISAIVNRDSQTFMGADGVEWTSSVEVMCKVADTAEKIVRVGQFDRSDQFVIDGAAWVLDRIVSKIEGMWTLRLSRTTALSRTSPGFRRK
jgi:hypothetical protein